MTLQSGTIKKLTPAGHGNVIFEHQCRPSHTSQKTAEPTHARLCAIHSGKIISSLFVGHEVKGYVSVGGQAETQTEAQEHRGALSEGTWGFGQKSEPYHFVVLGLHLSATSQIIPHDPWCKRLLFIRVGRNNDFGVHDCARSAHILFNKRNVNKNTLRGATPNF